MSAPVALPAPDPGATLLESDAVYFEAAARVEPVQGATIAVLPGLETLASGAVVQRVDTGRASQEPVAWLDAVRRRLRGLGVMRVRLYLHDEPAPLVRALVARGFRRNVEVGLVGAAGGRASGGPSVELQPVRDAAGWAEKVVLHQACAETPDGHASDPSAYVEMERRKVDAGLMDAFLAVLDGQVVGAVAMFPIGGLARLKNLVVHPAYRQRGVALATVGSILARAEQGTLAGCFALAGGPALRVYQRAGMVPVTQQVEWVWEPAARSEVES